MSHHEGLNFKMFNFSFKLSISAIHLINVTTVAYLSIVAIKNFSLFTSCAA